LNAFKNQHLILNGPVYIFCALAEKWDPENNFSLRTTFSEEGSNVK